MGKRRSSLLPIRTLRLLRIVSIYSHIVTWSHLNGRESGILFMLNSLICYVGSFKKKHQNVIRSIKALLGEMSMKDKRERVEVGR